MTGNNEPLANSQAFKRLVQDRYRNSVEQRINVKEIQDIEQRSKTIIRKLERHYKKHYDKFVAQETMKLLLKNHQPTLEYNPPGISSRKVSQYENQARRIVERRFKMKVLKAEQATERMQLKALSKHQQVNMVQKAYRVKERGLTIKTKLKNHQRKHFDQFADKEFGKQLKKYERVIQGSSRQGMSKIEFVKMDSAKIRASAKKTVKARNQKRLDRVDRITEKKHRQMLTKARKKHTQTM